MILPCRMMATAEMLAWPMAVTGMLHQAQAINNIPLASMLWLEMVV
jgi:hypothetical protein